MDVTYIILMAFLPPAAMLTNQNGTSVQVEGHVIDLTHTIALNSPIPPWWPSFNYTRTLRVNISEGVVAEGYAFTLPEHSGTHIDAPKHFCQNGIGIDRIPIEQFSGPGVVLNFRSEAEVNIDYEVTVDDLQEWESFNGRIPDNAILMLDFGWNRFWPNITEIYNSKTLADGTLHHPGLSPAASRWLTTKRNLNAVGIDTPSIDYGQTTFYETHVDLCRNSKIIIENVHNLDRMPPVGSWIFIGAPKIGNGTGTPSRVFAIIGSGGSNLNPFGILVALSICSILVINSAQLYIQG